MEAHTWADINEGAVLPPSRHTDRFSPVGRRKGSTRLRLDPHHDFVPLWRWDEQRCSAEDEMNREILRGCRKRTSRWSAAPPSCFGSRGAEAFDAGLVHPELRWHPAVELDPGVYVGQEGLATFMRGWIEPFESWSTTLEEVREVNGYVLGLHTQEAHGKGSSAPVSMRFAALYTFNDGVIEEIRLYLDENEALKAAEIPP